jgi:hypothetical protein
MPAAMTTENNHRSLWQAALSRAERAALARLERECPDSIGLVERIAGAVLARAPDKLASVLAMIRAGLSAFRAAHADGDDAPECFGAFVDGMTEALPRKAQPVVARALSRWQREALARRLPPSQQLDTDSEQVAGPWSLTDSEATLDPPGDLD